MACLPCVLLTAYCLLSSDLWQFLPLGYLTTIAIETPILLLLLSRGHSVGRRLLAGVWLTACTYPIVILVLPVLIPAPEDRWLYLLIAETFAPVAECALFAAAFHRKRVGWTNDGSHSKHPPDSMAVPDRGERHFDVGVVDYAPANLKASHVEPNRLVDFVAITLANLASFGIGEILNRYW
ncbi:hypothetical protein [Humisphaera borealis]|uniref:Uncharacterized protein n=1 Tax=Humisphaera borealis TaxID=2807512 RepID=A0A7M2WUX7_9BACT|nr:hypothetical protein [Humisphaera borealis]QOV89114.1 hypothetical protein IPV69_23305 [Humisphaera borealis]